MLISKAYFSQLSFIVNLLSLKKMIKMKDG